MLKVVCCQFGLKGVGFGGKPSHLSQKTRQIRSITSVYSEAGGCGASEVSRL